MAAWQLADIAAMVMVAMDGIDGKDGRHSLTVTTRLCAFWPSNHPDWPSNHPQASDLRR
jgi:hypothetical protein